MVDACEQDFSLSRGRIILILRLLITSKCHLLCQLLVLIKCLAKYVDTDQTAPLGAV